jgi:hypothetical protein
MPLRDHFHRPLSPRRHWTSFHAAWATFLSSQLNRLLPADYYAEPLCTFVVEIDVATFDLEEQGNTPGGWTPSAPAQTVPIAAATDTVEVRVYRQEGGAALAACIELVSPSNKDRPAERDAFVSKCVSYLHEGIGLLVVDIVTSRLANLHTALLARMSPESNPVFTSALYTAAYRPVRREEQSELSVWQEALVIGQQLPKMPLWLREGPCLPVELEETYEQTCRELRLQSNGSPVT